MPFEETLLWKRSFAGRGSGSVVKARERLKSSYRRFWNNSVDLSQTIQTDLPGLTLHDERHFTALWERASLLTGKAFPLNPVEAFVLGGAILLHDAGHALATYRGRLEELQKTPQWRDKLAMALRQPTGEPATKDAMANPPAEVKDRVLFDTLRVLHAQRAVQLAEYGVIDPATGDTLHLIDDDQIRKHLGESMGLIAASHHWNLDQLEAKLQTKVGAISGMPDAWAIDPIKIACVLRCADAIQIDQTRAPDFLYAQLLIRGVSDLHWRAQNRLASPTLDHKDPKSLLFTSTKAFERNEADAWWIAFDAINQADKEIQQTNIFLGDLGRPTLSVARIRDANSPERLALSVKTRGWRPVSAEVKISNVGRVVSWFGGEALYGKDLTVPIRELVQNASDAVRARRAIEPANGSYKGQIVLSISEGKDNGMDGFWLSVEDDGIGMSERTLVGPLLDFGTSGWASELLQVEFPGLAGHNLRQTGRYGIGFFSVFMLTERVVVDSRRFNRGIDQQRSLSFSKGLLLRPLLLETPDRPLSVTMSTRVSLFLNKTMVEECLAPKNNGIPVKITLGQLVGRLCPMLDCEVVVKSPDGGREIAHSDRWYEMDALAWLRQIEVTDRPWGGSERDETELARAAPLVKLIRSGSCVVGRACIDFSNYGHGLLAEGGLLVPNGDTFWYHFSAGFFGCIEQAPSGPRRSAGEITVDLSRWASEQAHLLALGGLNEREGQTAAMYIAQHGGDPTPLAAVIIENNFVGLSGVIGNFIGDQKELAFLVEKDDDEGIRLKNNFRHLVSINENLNPVHRGSRHKGNLVFNAIEFVPGIAWMKDISPNFSLEISYISYYDVPRPGVPAQNSFLGCLIRMAHERGFSVVLELDEKALIGHGIECSGRPLNLKDKEIRGMVVRTQTRRIGSEASD